MCVTVQTIENILNELAPMETAESYDNVGALVGRRDAEVANILVALDCTMDVVKEAKKRKANLIVTHHPLLFHARKNMLEEDAEGKILCELIRSHISLIAAHTNGPDGIQRQRLLRAFAEPSEPPEGNALFVCGRAGNALDRFGAGK